MFDPACALCVSGMDLVHQTRQPLALNCHHDLALEVFVGGVISGQPFNGIQNLLQRRFDGVHLAMHRLIATQRHARISPQVKQHSRHLRKTHPVWRRQQARDVIRPTAAQGAVYKHMAWGASRQRRLGHDAQSFLIEQRPSLVNTPAPSRPFAYLCLALSMSLVGSYVALSKPLAAVLPVLLLAWMRFGIGGVAMLHWLKKPANEPPLTPQTKRLLFLESFLGNFLFTICMIYGVSLTDAVSAGVTMAAIPAAVALMGWAFLGERVAPRTWMAVLCAVIGIALFSLSKPEHAAHMEPALGAKNTANHALWGQMLLLGAVICEAAYTVIGKKLTGSLGPKRITSLINLWGFVLTTPFGLYLALDFPFASVGWGTWLLLLFYALAACMWTVWLWMTGLKAVPAAQGGVFSVMLPVSAALVGVLFLGEVLTGLQLVAFVIALASVLLATLPSRAALRVGRRSGSAG